MCQKKRQIVCMRSGVVDCFVMSLLLCVRVSGWNTWILRCVSGCNGFSR